MATVQCSGAQLKWKRIKPRTFSQVSNWFANARRRLKNVVQEQRCSWSKRLRLYNQCVQVNNFKSDMQAMLYDNIFKNLL